MRRSLLTIAAAATATVAFASTVAAADGPRLSPGGEAKFPHRSFLLSLPPGSTTDPDGVRVFENGDPVRELAVKPAGSTADTEFGTVLVIDASNSMRGEPIERAMEAARAFAEHRRPAQKLGVVTFNRTTRTLLAPTTDDAAIEAALADTPPLAKQTHLRDGAMAGLRALERANVNVGSVIVMSDGADTGSRTSVGEITAAAQDSAVRVFTVGLESRFFEEGPLGRLAAAGGGDYRVAQSSDALARIYDELGEQLANEYLVRYASVLGPKKRITVQAVADGVPGSATVRYTSPAISGPTLPPANPEANGLWGSPAAMVAVGFGAAFLLCLAIAMIFAQRHRPETAEERVAAFVALGSPDGLDTEEEEDQDKLYARIESRLHSREWWRKFTVDVDIARLERPPAQIALVTIAATVFIMWLFVAISGAGWVGLFAFLVPFGVRRFVAHRAAKQRIMFGEQLADNLQVIASAMRAGQSFGGALAVAVEDAPEPAKREFERVVADERLGIPLEDSLGAVVDRMDNRDLHQVALVATLQREAGGNSAEVLDRVADTIRDRVSLRRLVSTLTAQGRLSRWVVTMVPVGLALFIGLTTPGYLDPLFHTTAGNVMLGIAITMGITGSLIMKKIADIKV